MNKKETHKSNYIVIALIIAVVILTVVRICGSTTKDEALDISGKADGDVQMVGDRYLELEFDTPIEGLTGFSFQFRGHWVDLKDSKFGVKVAIENDPLHPKILYEDEIRLIDQAYDYYNEVYRAFLPFKGDVNQGDHLRVSIMGIGISEEDEIIIKTSSQPWLSNSTFEVNDFVQDSMIAASFYYQIREMRIWPILIQSMIMILLILLGGELWKKPKAEKKQADRQTQAHYARRLLRLLPVFILLVLALDYAYYAGVRTQIQNLDLKDDREIYAEESVVYRELCAGEAVFCEWKEEDNRLGGLGIYLREPYQDDGVFSIEISELESQNLVASVQKAIYEMEPGQENLLKVSFDAPIKKSGGMEYLVAIYYSGEPVELLMLNNGENTPVLAPLYRKNTFLNVLFFLLAIFILVFTCVVFLCAQNRMKLEKLLFIAMIFLGILFETVITPFAVPDESAHIDSAYRLSNQMLGVEETNIKDAIYKRECDIYSDSGIKRSMNIENYRWLYEDFFRTEGSKNRRLTFVPDSTNNSNSLFFLPAAIGMTIGRILGLGFFPMIFLARTANLLLASFMICQAVKKIPFGKSVLCVVALLPITLQQAASCSYDALIIAVSLLYVSYCVFAMYSKRKLERAEALILIITAIMLGISKGGAYTPLYLLGFWMLIKRGYIRLPQKKEWKIAGIAALGVAAVAGVIAVVQVFRHPVDPYSLRNGFYPLNYLVQHPIETIRIFENTLYESLGDYITQCIGGGLGFLNISARFIVPLGYMILMGMAVIGDEKRLHVVNGQDKCVFLISALLCSGAILAAMLLGYTYYGRTAIRGVQGRYFIPVLWLFMISARSGRIVHKKKQYKKIVTAGYLLGVCTILQVAVNVLKR